MSARIIEVLGSSPLTLDKARKHLNLIPNDDSPPTHHDDDQIQDAINDATAWAEAFTRRAISLKRYEMAIDNFPFCSPVALPFAAPLVDLESIHYLDLMGVEQLLATTIYHVTDHTNPAIFERKYGAFWPAVAKQSGAIKITYTAGFVADAIVPPDIMRALKQVMAEFFENREDSTPLNMRPVSFTAKNLLQPHRLYHEGAV